MKEAEKKDIFGMMAHEAEQLRPYKTVGAALVGVFECVQVFVASAAQPRLTDIESERLCRVALHMGAICGRFVNDIRQGHVKAAARTD